MADTVPQTEATASPPPPLVSLPALCRALDPPHSPASPSIDALLLPRDVGHHRASEVFVRGVVRAVLVLTARLTFLTLQALPDDVDDDEEAEEGGADATPPSEPSQLVQAVLKLNDKTGWSAAQQEACRAQLQPGCTILLHAFVEINPTATVAAAADSSAGAAPAELHLLSPLLPCPLIRRPRSAGSCVRKRPSQTLPWPTRMPTQRDRARNRCRPSNRA